MRTIKVSDSVWKAIAERGKFGETEDDVLRREFGLKLALEPPRSGRRGRGALRYATKPMSARLRDGKLIVEFAKDNVRREWPLPSRGDKEEIRKVREAAVAFALENGATDPGQTNAVRKALTNEGYHLTK